MFEAFIVTVILVVLAVALVVALTNNSNKNSNLDSTVIPIVNQQPQDNLQQTLNQQEERFYSRQIRDNTRK